MPFHKDNLKALLSKVHTEYIDISQYLQDAKNDSISGNVPHEDMVDLGFLCRELAALFDDLRKECDAYKESWGRELAAYVAKTGLNTGSLTIQGEYASATAYIQKQPKLPKKGTKEYAILCHWLGVSDKDIIDKGFISFSFHRLAEFITEKAKKGEQPPPGIIDTYTRATVIYKRKS